ncbi:MAG: Bax inhibitor-1/YccA family protein [Bacteroidales bacterium]|nr:Bax inhibitor-1/YccA family protein [Bacteroidales bacterium]MCF8403504.1 Bax inhibitor-1/YccA family protein [Bacteroidales bacterium]
MLSRNNFGAGVQTKIESTDLAKNFIANVFAWMGIALAISAFTAFYFATNENLIFSLINPETGGMTVLGWIVMLSPFGFVLAMGMGFQKFSASTLILLFGAFAILMGASLSFILLVYTSASVFKTFVVTAGMFGIMSFVGYTTKTDLTKFGSLMFMGLIGIIIASVINMFMQSGTFDYIISFIGVLVFTGLTAYDVQKLKRIGAGVQYGTESTRKLVIMGALSLYLDFINLFLFLLRFLGNRR